jgi:cell division protein FtsZ
VDFVDVRTIMENAGSALMGIGIASGEKRAEEAARAAISSPLLDVSIHGAKGVLFSVAGGSDLGMLEIQDAANIITEAIDPDAKVIFGAVNDDTLKKGEIRVTVIATGFPDNTPGSSTASGINSFFGSSAARLSNARTAEVVERRTQEVEAEQASKQHQPEKIEKKEINNEMPKPNASKPEPKVVPASEQDDDDWASFPSFLRRK